MDLSMTESREEGNRPLAVHAGSCVRLSDRPDAMRPAQRHVGKTMHNPSEWDYDEASLSLAKPLFDAEIQIGREILDALPLASLPPVPVRARIGDLSTEFVIARRHVSKEIGPRQEVIEYILCCIDYNRL